MIAIIDHVTGGIAVCVVVLVESLPTPETAIVAVITIASSSGIFSIINLRAKLGGELDVCACEQP